MVTTKNISETRPKTSATSTMVVSCQSCGGNELKPVIFLGYLPLVNNMPTIGCDLKEEPSYPTELLYCTKCTLAQLGIVINPELVFPPEYPYTSSTTKILRENFAELYKECASMINIGKNDLIVDIGSNDGNLLSNFQKNHRVCGVTPEEIGRLAIEKGIPTYISYFNGPTVDKIIQNEGKASVVTATNVFAHIDDVHTIIDLIIKLLDENGVFISESHYLASLIDTVQYDTIYHEHLRYYSLQALKNLFDSHGLEIFHAKEIPTHGGSIRVYAARKGQYDIKNSVREQLDKERQLVNLNSLMEFKKKVVLSKLQLLSMLFEVRQKNERVIGISAPSRSSTLINYTGLDVDIIESIVEIKGSYKIGKYVPGTTIPVLDEKVLFDTQPEYAILFSWHIADELMPKLKAKGFKGDFIIPLPKPYIVRNKDVK